MPWDESVMVVPRTWAESHGLRFGLRSLSADDFLRILTPGVVQFLPRREAETDPRFLQLIPYVVLKTGGRVFSYCRGAAGTESRLRGLWSIGLGGHISQSDDGSVSSSGAAATSPEALLAIYRAGLSRELNEELTAIGPYEESALGLIYDPRTPVGEVHWGVLHRWQVQSPVAQARETGLAEAAWRPWEACYARRDEFETWSQFVLTENQ